MEQFNPTHEEFLNTMSQMYPTETARVFAEIRNAKMQAYIEKLEKGDNDESTD